MLTANPPHPAVTPSVLAQTGWEAGRFAFPRADGIRYFNPSLAHWRGTTYLVTRRCCHVAIPHRNDITFWQLDTALRHPANERAITFPNPHPADNWEDPRTFTTKDALWLSYATFRPPCPRASYVQQGLVAVASDFRASTPILPPYGNNRDTPHANVGHEKNWLWFVPPGDDAFHFIYRTNPHAVCRFASGRITHQHHKPSFKWPYGAPRGGTPPIYHDGLYWSFFHSSLDISDKPPRRRYFMGAYAFTSDPPFTPRWFTPEPLLVGSIADPRQPIAPLCVFPCGSLLLGNEWLVSFGINDESCGWIRIPHAALTPLLTAL